LINNPLSQLFLKKEKARLPYSVFKPAADEYTFLKSVFENRPPTAFFPYPSYVKTLRQSERLRTVKRADHENIFMSFKITDNTHIYNAVVNSCKCAGFTMLEHDSPYFNL
jgi:hypothetical protein